MFTMTNTVYENGQSGAQCRVRKKRPSVADVGFFEGAEKLLEVWFEFDASCPGLKLINRCEWQTLLDTVKCEIVSCSGNEAMDAYILSTWNLSYLACSLCCGLMHTCTGLCSLSNTSASESSMFVSRDRLTLKTCGSTTLLHIIHPLFSYVKSLVGDCTVKDLFYSRKDFLEPHRQEFPHCSFADEVVFLKQYFPEGSSYSIGPNGNKWHLFVVNSGGLLDRPDRTLEILMSEISDSAAQYFCCENNPTGVSMRQDSGILQLFPGATVDDKAFEPCGYSMNAIVKGDEYCNIHVTPQDKCSYASLETNSTAMTYQDLLQRTLTIFQPQSFIVTFFTNEGNDIPLQLITVPECFSQKHICNYQLKGYRLLVACFEQAEI